MQCAKCLAITSVNKCRVCGKYMCQNCMPSDICIGCRIVQDEKSVPTQAYHICGPAP